MPEAVPDLVGGESASDLVAIARDTGTVNVYVVCTDFPDAPGERDQIVSLKSRMSGNNNKLVKSFYDQSHGKLQLNITWDTAWRRMPHPVTTYVPRPDYWEYKRFVKDAVGLVPTNLPDSQVPQIVVAAVPNTDKFIHSSAAHNVTVDYKIPDARSPDGQRLYKIHHEINLCDKSYGEHYTTLMHEIGHCFGLVDLYPFNSPKIHKVGPWDVMGDIQYATGFLAWHQKILGWLDADRMTCLKTGDLWYGHIVPSSYKSGMCMVAVRPTGNTSGSPKSLYIVQATPEVRGRPKEPGQDGTVLSAEGRGLLVYKVCAEDKTNDQKPLEVIPYKRVTSPDSSSRELITFAPFMNGTQRADLPFTLGFNKDLTVITVR
jgi:M6 family metalloprotease-like protein